jgi:hypothetical protein
MALASKSQADQAQAVQARCGSGKIERLEIACKEGNPDLIELNSEPLFDGLRSDPRFSDLMRPVGVGACPQPAENES